MVEIKIINDSLDLFPNEVISFTLAINDLASIENRQGNYSNQFTIPATANNSNILGYPDKLNFVTGFKPTKSREARILKDGLELQRGFIQVEQYDETEKEFTISFFSGNTDWIDDIGDKSLQELDTSSLDHEYSIANITGSFTNTEGYIYPWVNYGRYGGRTGNNTSVTDWKPAMFSHSIIKQIFKDADWKVEGNLFNDPFFLKEVVNYSSEPSLGDEVLEGLGFKATNAGGYSPGTSPIVFGNVRQGNTFGNYNNTTGVYTCNQGFRATVRAKVRAFGLSEAVQIRVNGVSVASQGGSIPRVLEYTADFLAGDTIDIRLALGTALASERQVFELVVKDRNVEGSTVRMNSVLPDMAQSDFINDIFNRYGVLFSVDNISRTVYIDKFETVKDNTVNALDWTSKLDVSKEIEIDYTELVSDYGRKNFYKYTPNEDNDNSGGNLEDLNTDIGDGEFNIDNDFISKEEEIFESAFSSSLVIGCFSGAAIAMYIPIYSTNTDTKEQRAVTPRISIVAGLVDAEDIFTDGEVDIDINGNTSSTTVTEVPFCYFHIQDTGIDTIDSIGQGLSFGNPFIPIDQDNLLDRYYEDYIKILNNPRRVTAYFLLNERDINNLDFLTPIYIGGELNSYFYINQIEDYRPNEGGITKVELVLI